MKFIRPFDPSTLALTTPTGGRWSTFIGPFLSSVATEVALNATYYPEYMDLDGSSGKHFENTLSQLDSATSNSDLRVIRGGVGIGKTAFWKRWLLTGTLPSRSVMVDLNDQMKWDNASGIRRFAQAIACTLNTSIWHHAPSNAKKTYISILENKILSIKAEKRITTMPDDEFVQDFVSQTPDFCVKFDKLDGALHLSCVISAIWEAVRQPVWIVIDNCDLHSRNLQVQYIDASRSIFINTQSQCSSRNWDCIFHVAVTCRRETFKSHRSGSFHEFNETEFPNPDVQRIALQKIKESLLVVAAREDAGSSPLSFEVAGVPVHSHTDIANQIIDKLGTTFSLNRWPFRYFHPSEWHGALVDFNVRRFVKHWSRLILSGSFVDDWVYPSAYDERIGDNPYQYLRFLITAGYPEYPGNDRIDATSDYSEGPLLVNLYGVPFPSTMNDECYFRNYLIYIRVLQLLNLRGDDMRGDELFGALRYFYDSDCILSALKFLTWTRLIREIEKGIRNLGEIDDWREMPITKDNLVDYVFRKSRTTELYLGTLLGDFSYLTEISVVSYQLQRPGITINTNYNYSQLANKVELLYGFLKSLQRIIIGNLESYKQRETLTLFRDTWVSRGASQRPWHNAIVGTIEALENLRLKYAGRSRARGYNLEKYYELFLALRREGQDEITKALQD